MSPGEKGLVPLSSVNEIRPQDRQFLGHPIGLWVLFTTEMWERFCYYGMRAFLVMYLYFSVSSPNPGFGWSEKEAYELYGWFTGLVYLLPIIGGFIADRFIGQHRSVLYGGILIAIGEFCLFLAEFFRNATSGAITFQSSPGAWLSFMGGLGLIIVGTGFFKPCISVMVGQLYGRNDSRRDVAFTIFYMGINVGALLAPFVAGTIAEKIGWHWGFLTATIGMVFGLITYSVFRPKYLGHIGMLVTNEHQEETEEEKEHNRQKKLEASRPLSRVDIDRIVVILVLSFFCIAFWSVFEQAGSSLSTFAKKETNRRVPSAMASVKWHPFMMNEDEADAVAALNAAQLDLARAMENWEKIDSQRIPARDQLIQEGKFDDSLKLYATEFDRFSSNALSSVLVANMSLKKANEARKQAGLDPANITVPNMATLLEQGQKKIKEMNSIVENRCGKEFMAAPLSGKSPEEIEAARLQFKESILHEIIRDDQINAEKERIAAIDPAKAIYTFPASWYQSVNPIGIVVLAPLFAWLWGFLARHRMEPSTPVKFGMSLVILSIAYIFMIAASVQAQRSGGNANAIWLFNCYLFCTVGELCVSPVGLSMVSRLAPQRYASLLMGVWFLSSSVACYLSGKLVAVLGSGGADGSGRVYFCFGPSGGLADYFMIMALAPFVAGLIIFMIAPILRKMMHED